MANLFKIREFCMQWKRGREEGCYVSLDRFLRVSKRGLEVAFRDGADLSTETISRIFGEQLRKLPMRKGSYL